MASVWLRYKPMATSIVRDFMAKESNKHIETDQKDDLIISNIGNCGL